MKTQYQRMLDGKLYVVDNNLKEKLYETRRKLRDFNGSITKEEIEVKALDLFGAFGKNSSITPPFRCDYGKNIYIGDNVYLNYNISIIDVCEVHIGNNVMIAPDCSIYTASHPIDAFVRNTGIEYGSPIIIEKDCRIGGNVTILPGVSIGEGSIIGAGSVITRDIPPHVIAVGNPCEVLREIDDEDHKYRMERYKKFSDEYDMDDRSLF